MKKEIGTAVSVVVFACSLVPLGLAHAAWEEALTQGAQPILGQAKNLSERKAAEAEQDKKKPAESKETLGKNMLEAFKKLDGLLVRLDEAKAAPATPDSKKKVAALLKEIRQLSKTMDESFGKLGEILVKEVAADTESEAKTLGTTVKEYRKSGTKPIWEAFIKKTKALQADLDRSPAETLFLEHTKLGIRIVLQRGRFVADNEEEAERAFSQLTEAVSKNLGFGNIKKHADLLLQTIINNPDSEK